MHHRDQLTKFSHRIWTWTAARRAVELEKCEPVCRACHMAMHALLARKPHGLSGYRRGCRCDICRAAIAPQIAQQRRRRLLDRGLDPAAPHRRGEHLYSDKYVRVDADAAPPAEGESGKVERG